MPLHAIEPQRLYRQIAEQLRVLIGKGEFAAGERLPAERDLARQLGVSRPTVREALIALEVQDWVEVRVGSGVYVQERTQPKATNKQAANEAIVNGHANAGEGAVEWGPLELIRARRVLEGETAAIAAAHAKRKDIAALKQAIATMQQEAASGEVPQAGDRAFHTAVVQAGGNSVLTETVQNFYDARRGPIFTRLGDHFETPKSWKAAIHEHEAIMVAIAGHDADGARAAMHKHLDNSHKRFSANWRR